MDDLEKAFDLINERCDAANELATQDVVDAIAVDDHDHHAARYALASNDAAVRLLADDTFKDTKHFLRGKIGPEVDVVWQMSRLRKPLREKSMAAAKKVLPGA